MPRRSPLAFALFVAGGFLIGPAAQARETGIVGTLTKIEPRLLQVTTDRREVIPVAVNAETTYRKWIMAKPWQQDIRADARSLRVGQRVRVDVAERDPITARTVWIVVGRVGAID